MLQAGRGVLSEKGYDAETSAEITKRLGIQEVTVALGPYDVTCLCVFCARWCSGE
jgi:hypothetical protein